MRHFVIIFVALCVVVAVGCQRKPQPVAVVGGEEITEETVDRLVKARLQLLEQQGAQVDLEALRSAVLDDLIAERLLMQGAREQGIAVSDEEVTREVDRIRKDFGEEQFQRNLAENGMPLEEFREHIRERLMMDLFAASMVGEGEVGDEEVKEFYEQNPSFFEQPERVHVRFIQTKTAEEAEALLGEMKDKGLGFDEMADLLRNENRAVVSNYGWTNPAMYSPQITDALKEMEKGDYRGPLKGRDAYYLMRLKDRRGRETVSLQEARDGIRAMLLAQKRQAAVGQWVNERKKTADIEVR